MLLGTLGASLLGDVLSKGLSGRRVIRVVEGIIRAGQETIRAGQGTIRAGQETVRAGYASKRVSLKNV